MRKFLSLVLLVIAILCASCSHGSVWGNSESASIEIRFHEIEWGSSSESVSLMITAAATTSITNGRIVVVSPVFTALLFLAVSFPEELSVCADNEEVLLLSELVLIDTVLFLPVSEDCSCVSDEAGVGVTVPALFESSPVSGPTSCLLPAIPNGLKECVLNTMIPSKSEAKRS